MVGVILVVDHNWMLFMAVLRVVIVLTIRGELAMADVVMAMADTAVEDCGHIMEITVCVTFLEDGDTAMEEGIVIDTGVEVMAAEVVAAAEEEEDEEVEELEWAPILVKTNPFVNWLCAMEFLIRLISNNKIYYLDNHRVIITLP